jgi:hypothetical protein
MYARTAVLPVRATALRRAYVLVRVLDDALDGDRAWPGDPEAFARRLLEDAHGGYISGSDPVSRLARRVFVDADRLAREGEVPSRWLTTLVETMLFDAERARKRLVLPDSDLTAHLLRTFGSALDTALSLAGATLRADDLPDVTEAQAALYTLRDLALDLSRGLVNVPAEVVATARDEGVADLSAAGFLSSDAVRAWRGERLEAGTRHVVRARAVLAAARDRRARWVVSPLLTGLRFLARRLGRRRSTNAMHRCPVALEGV